MNKWTLGQLGKTNPNEANSKKVKMNVSRVITMDYENISNWAKRTQFKPKQTQFVVSLSNLFPNLPRQHFLMAIPVKNKYAHIVDNCRNCIRNNYLKGHIMSYLPIAVLSINFCCFLFDLIFPSNKHWKTHFLKLPVILQKLFVFITVGPLFIAPVIPQSRFDISTLFSLPIGILLFILGWIIIIFAFLKIGVIPAVRKKSDLITSGIYSFIRHPIYSGTLISVLGWNILFKSIISMIYFPLLCLLYIVATILEEKALIEEYGDEYINYKKKVTKRLIPFIF